MTASEDDTLDEHELLATLPRRRVEQVFLISLVLLVISIILITIWILFMVQGPKDNWYAWPLWVSMIVMVGFFIAISFTIKRFVAYRRGDKFEDYRQDEEEIQLRTADFNDVEVHDDIHSDDSTYAPPSLPRQ
jgi:Kef-type K+ transport system membrane component KefB